MNNTPFEVFLIFRFPLVYVFEDGFALVFRIGLHLFDYRYYLFIFVLQPFYLFEYLKCNAATWTNVPLTAYLYIDMLAYCIFAQHLVAF